MITKSPLTKEMMYFIASTNITNGGADSSVLTTIM